jgi:hypothetical protein
MRLSDLLVESGEAALRLQRPDGSLPAGFNGPYRDPETPVRTTAHWLMTFLKAHDISGASRFRDGAARAAEYLASPHLRPAKATYLCRQNPGKDLCNGLIGQAWAIEALLRAAETLGERYRHLAAEVFELHPFDDEIGLWRIVHVDGRPGRIDSTFNHQLWFAAAGGPFAGTPGDPIGRQVHRFLECARIHLRLTRSGRIRHSVILPESPHARAAPRRWANALRSSPGRWLTWLHRCRREIGYHAFNLHALARLRQRIPSHPFWGNARSRAILRYVGLPEFVRGLERNEYAYVYNPVGFEIALALQVFAPVEASRAGLDAWWVARQLERTYDRDKRLMQRGATDPTTLAARLYEACWLRDVPLAWTGNAGRGSFPADSPSD